MTIYVGFLVLWYGLLIFWPVGFVDDSLTTRSAAYVIPIALGLYAMRRPIQILASGKQVVINRKLRSISVDGTYVAGFEDVDVVSIGSLRSVIEELNTDEHRLSIKLRDGRTVLVCISKEHDLVRRTAKDISEMLPVGLVVDGVNPISHTPVELARIENGFDKVRRKQYLIAIPAVVAFVVLTATTTSTEQSIWGIPPLVWAAVATVVLLVTIAFAWHNWKCPVCGSLLGGSSVTPRHCKKCGTPLGG